MATRLEQRTEGTEHNLLFDPGCLPQGSRRVHGEQLVENDCRGVRHVQDGIPGFRRHGDEEVTSLEVLVTQAEVLPAEEEREGAIECADALRKLAGSEGDPAELFLTLSRNSGRSGDEVGTLDRLGE